MSFCEYPNCSNKLSSQNRSGMCKEHTHAIGYCRCTWCTNRQVGLTQQEYRVMRFRPSPSKAKPKRWLFKLQQAKANEMTEKKAVTLPKAPWEDRE